MIKVNKDSSLAAALEIDEIVTSISNSMATLDENIRKNIPISWTLQTKMAMLQQDLVGLILNIRKKTLVVIGMMKKKNGMMKKMKINKL